MNVLYQENDWVYVIGEDQREGFIPHSYCAPYTPHLGEMTLTVKKKLPRDLGIPNSDLNVSTSAGPGGGGTGAGGGGDTANQHNTTMNSSRKFPPFQSLEREAHFRSLNKFRVLLPTWDIGFGRRVG